MNSSTEETYYIVFRDHGGGGYSLGGFNSLVDATKKADEIFKDSRLAYYTIYLDNCDAFPYGEIAVFKGDQQEFTKNNGLTFQDKEKQFEKWNREYLAKN